MRKGWAAPLSAAIVLVALSSVLLLYANVTTSTGTVAPSFTVKDIDGRNVSSEELRGNVVVLHLAVIYCGGVITDPGKYQIEQLKIARDGAVQGVEFLTVTSENCPTTDLLAIRQQQDISWSLVNDWPDLKIFGPYADYFSQHGDPTLVIIDADGNVVSHSGVTGSGDILKAVNGAKSKTASQSPASAGFGYAGMFALGALTSLAPCSIALLATMLAFLISRQDGKTADTRKGGIAPAMQGLSIGLYFTIGTGLVFLLMGFLVGSIDLFVTLSPAFFMIAGALLILLGLNSAFSLFERIGALLPGRSGAGGGTPGWARTVRKAWARSPEMGAFLLGVLFSLAWAPCAISLVLPVVVLMLASKVGLLAGGALLFFFGLGHAVPIIPIATVTETSRARLAERYMRVGKAVSVVFGLAVVVLGALFILRGFGVYLW